MPIIRSLSTAAAASDLPRNVVVAVLLVVVGPVVVVCYIYHKNEFATENN
jgi:hypothetical protein